MGKSYGTLAVIKALVLSFVITGIALFLLAFLMYKLGLSESAVDFGVTFIYIFATAAGGLLLGKTMKQKKFLWGLLLGGIYVMIIFTASFMMSKGVAAIAGDGISTVLLCLGGGMLGGMIS